MITTKALKDLFEKIKHEEDIDNLQEYKFNLTVSLGYAHDELHKEISRHSRSKILSIIASIKSVIQVINERSDKARHKNKREEKKENIELAHFIKAAKHLLPSKTYNAILKCAKELKHSEISKLKEKDLEKLEMEML